MREIRQSGSEGGVAGNDHPYPYRVNGEHPTSPPCRPRALTRRSAPETPGRGTRPTRVTGNTRRARLVGRVPSPVQRQLFLPSGNQNREAMRWEK